ncbi:MAG: long-chain fatty acid--CoA ligase [Myxococcota bacterium]
METYENLVDMFERSTKKYASRPALRRKKTGGAYQWLTYAEIAKQVDEFRGGLASLGVTPGDRVAIIADNGPAWAVAAYATYGLGGQYVPMYEAQLPKEWEYILRDSGTKVLLVANDKIEEKTKSFLGHVPTLQHIVNLSRVSDDATTFAGLRKIGREKPVPSIKPDAQDVCGFIYTSGTTGNPKGVLLTHENICSNVNAVHEVFPMSSEDVSLSFLPWAHSFGQTVELHCMLSYGASMGLAESVSKIIDNLAEVKPTLLFSVPRIFNRIYDGVNKKMAEDGGLKKKLFDRLMKLATEKKKLAAEGKSLGFFSQMQLNLLDKVVASKVRARFGGRLKYAFSGGAALSKDVADFIDNLNITVYEGYGLTETSPIATANWPDNRKIGSVGKPIPRVKVSLEPAEGAPEGQGEIVVHGPNIMKGYHNLPEEDAKVFTADRGFRTGDMGRIDADGFVFITGRVKEQYKLENGKYVAPAPLEEKLRLSPYIANLMVDGTNRPYNIAVIVADVDALKKWAAANNVAAGDVDKLLSDPAVTKLIKADIEKFGAEFKGFERPEKFILTHEDFTTDNGMLTPSLKVKRRVVMAKYGEQIAKLYQS